VLGQAFAEAHVYNGAECNRAQQDTSPFTSIGTYEGSGGTVYNSNLAEDLWLVCPITHTHAIQGDTLPVTGITVTVNDRHNIEAVRCQLRCIDDLTSSSYTSTFESTTGVAEYQQLSVDGTDGYVNGACFAYCVLPDGDNAFSAVLSYVADFE
jgi:hypothetical protein